MSPRRASTFSIPSAFNCSRTECTFSLVDETQVRCANGVTPFAFKDAAISTVYWRVPPPHTPYYFAKVKKNDTLFVEEMFKNVPMHPGIFVDEKKIPSAKSKITDLSFL